MKVDYIHIKPSGTYDGDAPFATVAFRASSDDPVKVEDIKLSPEMLVKVLTLIEPEIKQAYANAIAQATATRLDDFDYSKALPAPIDV